MSDSTTIPEGYKRCTKCGRHFPATLEFFRSRPSVKSGLTSWCLECLRRRAREYMAERRVLDPEFAERERRSCHDRYHKDYKYRTETKIRGRNAMRRWRQKEENKKKEREYMRAKRSDAQYADAERKRRRELIRKESYRIRRRVAQQKYKARKLGASGAHTREDILRQCDSQRGLCWWCGKPVGDDWHADHLIPLSRGGSNGAENIVIACRHCNQSKNNRLPHEWIGRLL